MVRISPVSEMRGGRGMFLEIAVIAAIAAAGQSRAVRGSRPSLTWAACDYCETVPSQSSDGQCRNCGAPLAARPESTEAEVRQ